MAEPQDPCAVGRVTETFTRACPGSAGGEAGAPLEKHLIIQIGGSFDRGKSPLREELCWLMC